MPVFDMCLSCGREFDELPEDERCPGCHGAVKRQKRFNAKSVAPLEIYRSIVEAVFMLNRFEEGTGKLLTGEALSDEADARQRLIDLCCTMWGEHKHIHSPGVAVDWFNGTAGEDLNNILELYQTMTYGSTRGEING